MFLAPAVVPPMVLLLLSILIPSRLLPREARPVAVVPVKLPTAWRLQRAGKLLFLLEKLSLSG